MSIMTIITHLDSLEHEMTVLSSALSLLFLLRSLHLQLNRHYPWVFSYQIIQCFLFTCAVFLGTSSALYARIFEYSSFAVVCATVLVVYELASHLFATHPGLRTYTKRGLSAGLFFAASTAVPAILSTHNRWHDVDFACMLFVYVEISRVIELAAVVYLICMTTLFKAKGARFSYNVRLFSITFIVTLFTDALGSTFVSSLRLSTVSIELVNLFVMGASLAACGASIILLRPECEEHLATVKIDPTVLSRLEHLHGVLQSCARSLLR
jgi:hypothetical protein